ncbi:MAG: hypothetical protein WKF86_10280 [Acidimicrobiales bacterium]
MTRVNITMPDNLHRAARRAGLNVSQLAQRAVSAELGRLAKIAELDAYLAELEAEMGATSADERAAAASRADGVLGRASRRRTA